MNEETVKSNGIAGSDGFYRLDNGLDARLGELLRHRYLGM
jgi:hypothetical protein